MDGEVRIPQPAPSPLIRVKGSRRSFAHHEVPKGIDLVAAKGDVVTPIGSSGSGKSTFIRCLNFLDEPADGEVVVNGERCASAPGGIHAASARTLLVRLRQPAGMVFQSFNLWRHRTVVENVIDGPVHVLGVDLGTQPSHEHSCTWKRSDRRIRQETIQPSFPADSSSAWRAPEHRPRGLI